MKPMLAGKLDWKHLRYPVICQPKFDGIRCVLKGGVAYSRTLKPLPNLYLQKIVKNWPDGIDCEITVGPATSPNCMQATSSGVMSFEGEPDLRFHLFDLWNDIQSYNNRFIKLIKIVRSISHATLTPFRECDDKGMVATYMDNLVRAGYEGMILRDPHSFYKFGRSTSREGQLLKYKYWLDDEATIIGFEELMSNQNEPEENGVGAMKRSHHKENMMPANTLGALIVKSPKYKTFFNIGSGFDAATRREIWNNRDKYIDKLVTFKYHNVGMLNVPRFPIFVRFRNED